MATSPGTVCPSSSPATRTTMDAESHTENEIPLQNGTHPHQLTTIDATKPIKTQEDSPSKDEQVKNHQSKSTTSTFTNASLSNGGSSKAGSDAASSVAHCCNGRSPSSHVANGAVTGPETETSIVVPTIVSDSPPLSDSALRTNSAASSRSGVGSPEQYSQCHTSSSSSLSHDLSHDLSQETESLSHDSSIASRSMLLDQLKSQFLNQRATSEPTLDVSRDASHDAVGRVDDSEVVTQLLEHIVQLKLELASLKEENKKLQGIRSTMDDELHTLTENLFEEAYKMVDDAKGGKVHAEKKLADATGKIDAMETEMSALKNLIEGGSVPDKNTLHPTTAAGPPSSSSSSSTTAAHKHHHKRPSVKKVVRKISKKAGIHVGRSSPTKVRSATTSVIKLLEHKSEVKGACLVEGEVIPEEFQDFSDWLQHVSTSRDHPFLARVMEVDVKPCLNFKNEPLSREVLCAVEENNLIMEALSCSAEQRGCALSHSTGLTCTHRLKLGDSEEWHFISPQCRERIVAACDFYMYLGHVRKGIIKLDVSKMYWQVARLRAVMSLARLSLAPPPSSPPQTVA